jgi:Fe-S cluster assembly iron-binding protein IscA
MDDKVKIKISEQAYDELLNVLADCPDYSHIRFKFKDGCCGSSKIEILLDNVKASDITDKIDNLAMVYDHEVLDNIKEIIVVFRNSSFMIKTLLSKTKVKDCSTCKVGCKSSGNSSGGCSGRCSGCK